METYEEGALVRVRYRGLWYLATVRGDMGAHVAVYIHTLRLERCIPKAYVKRA